MATLFDPNLGRRIEGHVLQAEIGRGGMGAAYVATHEALSHSKCVIKLMLAEVARIPQAIVRIQQEAEALSRLNKHEHIVKLQNFGVLPDGQFYLKFEFIEGKTLTRYVVEQGGTLPLRKAANFIFQVCSAMEFAHSLGIIHRDLKPDNIMIEFNIPGAHLKERVKVLDFGIAKLVHGAVDPTGSGQTLGTIRFMAPEQVTDAAAVSGKADVFSLAQVLYLVLTGRMPWGTPESDIAIYHKQRTEAPAWPPEELVPEAVARVIMRCLSLNPDDRPTMRELAIELAAAFEGGTEILAKVVPDWVESSPHDATTLPRPAVAEPTVTPAQQLVAHDVARQGHHEHLSPGVGTSAPKVPESLPRRTPDPTANARPRALAASLASAASATFGSSGVPSTPVRPQDSAPAELGSAAARAIPTPPEALVAGLPTGLISQRFDAQEPPPDAREPSIVVASEIELASGTPAGPQPYEHSEIPAVMVSNTQLTGVQRPPSAQVSRDPPPGTAPALQAPRAHEPAPFVVLPGAAARAVRSGRGKLVLLALATFAFAAVAVFGLARLGSRAPAAGQRRDVAVAVDTTPAPPAEGHQTGTIAHDAAKSPAPAAAQPDATIAPSKQSERAAHADAGTDPGVSPSAGPMTPDSTPRSATTQADTSALRRDLPTVHVEPPSGASADAPKGSGKSSDIAASTRSTPAARIPAKPAGASDAARSRTGVIIVRVPQAWAQVWIDQVDAGTTPVRAEKVPAGVHKVLLVGDSRRETVMVTVTPGGESVIERKW
jgi:serine/threonine protein kinase